MLNTLTTTVLGAMAVAIPAPQQSAQEVLETQRARQLERWETVDNYTVYSRMEGFEVPGLAEAGQDEIPSHYQKHEIDGRVAFGIVPGDEYLVGVAQAGEGGEYVTPEFFEAYADGAVMMADGLDSEMAKSGLPMLPGMNYPGNMMRDGAVFADSSSAIIERAEAGDFGRSNAAAELAALDEMAESLQLVGTTRLDRYETFHLRAEGLDRVVSQSEDGARFTVHTLEVWIDAEHYVTRRMSLQGVVERDGESREITMERLLEDYREVGPLYESHRQIMRITGIMGALSDDERKQLEEAQKQMEELEDMEEQLANLPASARGMVERQIAQARRQMEMLTGDGGFEMVTEVRRIEINTGPPPPGTRED